MNALERQRQIWTAGNYAAVGPRILLLSELLCEAVDLRSGEKVLDVACGDGNTALAGARRFARVTGIDFLPAILDRASRRARAEELNVTFVAADAEQLPFLDESFDVTLSVAGVMFSPNQELAAAEMLRVCRGGGRIGMVNWRLDGFLLEMFRTISRYAPTPPGHRHAAFWGDKERLPELFASPCTIQVAERTFLFRFLSPSHYVDFMCDSYGPYVEVLKNLSELDQQGLRRDMLEVVKQANMSGGRDLVLPLAYLEAIIVKPRA